MNNSLTGRNLLIQLGVGDFNATMMIAYLFVSPMTTDPKSPMIILMVKALQKKLNALGANLIVTGYLDRPTAAALTGLFGTDKWTSWAWSDVIASVVKAPIRDISIKEVPPATKYPIAATGDMPLGLPDVPGGLLTYAAAGAALYYFMRRK